MKADHEALRWAYNVLGLDTDGRLDLRVIRDAATIRNAYKAMALRHHPDRNVAAPAVVMAAAAGPGGVGLERHHPTISAHDDAHVRFQTVRRAFEVAMEGCEREAAITRGAEAAMERFEQRLASIRRDEEAKAAARWETRQRDEQRLSRTGSISRGPSAPLTREDSACAATAPARGASPLRSRAGSFQGSRPVAASPVPARGASPLASVTAPGRGAAVKKAPAPPHLSRPPPLQMNASPILRSPFKPSSAADDEDMTPTRRPSSRPLSPLPYPPTVSVRSEETRAGRQDGASPLPQRPAPAHLERNERCSAVGTRALRPRWSLSMPDGGDDITASTPAPAAVEGHGHGLPLAVPPTTRDCVQRALDIARQAHTTMPQVVRCPSTVTTPCNPTTTTTGSSLNPPPSASDVFQAPSPLIRCCLTTPDVDVARFVPPPSVHSGVRAVEEDALRVQRLFLLDSIAEAAARSALAKTEDDAWCSIADLFLLQRREAHRRAMLTQEMHTVAMCFADYGRFSACTEFTKVTVPLP